MAVVHLHLALGDLAAQGRIGTEEKLLASLALGVERPAHLHTTKGAVVQEAAVLTRKRHALRHALVDDARAHFRQAVHVGFAAAVVATFNGVVEQAVDRVPVVLVVLGGVDAPLSCNGVRSTRTVLETERLDVVAHLGERRRSRAACQSSTHHNHVDQTLVGRVDEANVVFVVGPLVRQRTLRCLGVKHGLRHSGRGTMESKQTQQAPPRRRPCPPFQ